MKIFIAYLLLVIVAFYKASATDFKSCDRSTGEVTSVEVQDCPDGAPCPLPGGTSKDISFTFKPVNDAQNVTAKVSTFLLNIDVPNADACASGILECPLKSGQSYTYENTIDIPQTVTGVNVDVKWQLIDESGKDIVCFTVASITAKAS